MSFFALVNICRKDQKDPKMGYHVKMIGILYNFERISLNLSTFLIFCLLFLLNAPYSFAGSDWSLPPCPFLERSYKVEQEKLDWYEQEYELKRLEKRTQKFAASQERTKEVKALLKLAKLYSIWGYPQEAVFALRKAGKWQQAETLSKAIVNALQNEQISRTDTLRGTSDPLFFRLENGMAAIWKPNQRLAEEFSWGSNYRFEIAAYRVSKKLRLDLVGATTEREVNGVKGSIQYFFDGTRSGSKVKDGRPQNLDLLDYLIANHDRWQPPKGQREGWSRVNYRSRLGGTTVAFDHSISFGIEGHNAWNYPKLESLIKSREIYDRLKSISKEEWYQAIGSLLKAEYQEIRALSKKQIEANPEYRSIAAAKSADAGFEGFWSRLQNLLTVYDRAQSQNTE